MKNGVVTISVSVGELLDRISILEIKSERLESPAKRDAVVRELDDLHAVCRESVRMDNQVKALFDALKDVNSSLWDIEDKLRLCEHNKTFDGAFVELARSVYRFNDRRSALKSQINTLVGSALTEQKSYASYS